MAQDTPRLPSDRQRLAIVGRTGTGKTIAALWHLSKRNLTKKPWIIYDFKGDEHLAHIQRARHVGLDFVPKSKDHGVFIVHPLPNEEDAVEAQMWKLWDRENVGLYIDEGYMTDNPALQAILTQGRSKHIPVIVLSQRPVWLSRFVFSEADFLQIFDLNDRRDRTTVSSFVPVDLDMRLPDFHSHYYDVGRNKLFEFKPVPREEILLEAIDAQLKPNRRVI